MLYTVLLVIVVATLVGELVLAARILWEVLNG